MQFLQSSPETVHHLLIECNHSQKIWHSLFEFITETSGVNIIPSKEEIILGMYNEDSDLSDFYNCILVIVKQYIYASRCLNKLPCLKVLIEKIKLERKLEYLLAIQNDKLHLWSRKWILLESINLE